MLELVLRAQNVSYLRHKPVDISGGKCGAWCILRGQYFLLARTNKIKLGVRVCWDVMLCCQVGGP